MINTPKTVFSFWYYDHPGALFFPFTHRKLSSTDDAFIKHGCFMVLLRGARKNINKIHKRLCEGAGVVTHCVKPKLGMSASKT